jgi:hypothetical protein
VVAARLAATPELGEPDGHALAGFLDAEAHFAIGRNNGGRNWRCSLHVVLRDDDAGVLYEFRRLTGMGTITAIPAYRTSKPQCVWSISSGLECLRMAQLLERFPLRGRKGREADVWIEAVRASEGRDSPDVDMATLWKRIRDLRRYAGPTDRRPNPAHDQAGLLWYFGGFFSGEGSFQLSRGQARAMIKLRRDDRALLLAFAALTGLGRVYDVKPSGIQSPSALWSIYAQSDLPATIELLEAARLCGRKRREFRAWRVGATEFIEARAQGRKRDVERIDTAAAALRGIREYEGPTKPPPARGEPTRRSVFVEILRTWARESPGPLRCTDYSVARRAHPDWPTRNTMIRPFGSWYEALRAAGLDGRAARLPRPRLA